MITAEIISQQAKRSPLTAHVPQDMIYYSHLGHVNDYPEYDNIHTFPKEPGYYQFINEAEKHRSILNYPDYDFKYYLNNIGFRGVYPNKDDDNIIGFFGCSFTFGEGLPEEKNFPYLISKHLNKRCLNLGLQGANAHHTSLIFSAASNIWNIDTAVITLPNWGRFSYVDKYNQLVPIMPTLNYKISEIERVRTTLVNNFSDQYLLSITKDAITTILAISKLKNIKLILSSWDGETRYLITTLLGIVPEFNHDSKNVARCPYHPGEDAVNTYTKNVLNFVNQNKFQNLG